MKTGRSAKGLTDWKITKKFLTGTLEGISVTTYIRRWDVTMGEPFSIGLTYTDVVSGAMFTVTEQIDVWPGSGWDDPEKGRTKD